MDLKARKRLRHYLFSMPRKLARDNRILKSAARANGTEASQLINDIINAKQFTGKYLEIGVERGFTFESIVLKDKTAVDPRMLFSKSIKNPRLKLFEVSSDEYFRKKIRDDLTFDLVYLDGLHTFEQTYLDLVNTFKHLNHDSIVVIDDTVPCDIFSSYPDQKQAFELREAAGFKNDGSWHGDTFKVVCVLAHLSLPNLNYRTLVDLQNPKTVVWLNDGYAWPSLPISLEGIPLEGFTYLDNFVPHISERFKPCTRLDFLEEVGRK